MMIVGNLRESRFKVELVCVSTSIRYLTFTLKQRLHKLWNHPGVRCDAGKWHVLGLQVQLGCNGWMPQLIPYYYNDE